MANDYKKYGRFLTMILYFMEGIYTIFFPILTKRGSESLSIATALFFIISILVFYFLGETKVEQYVFVEMLYLLCSLILSVVCANALRTPYPTLFLFFVQWLTAIIFLQKRLCVFLFLGQAIVNILMHQPYNFLNIHYFTGLQCFGNIAFLLIIFHVCIDLIDFIKGQIQRYEAQEQGLDDLMKLTEIMYEEAQAAAKSKSDFLSNMSHEMRTPINTMLGMNELIMRENKDKNILNYSVNIDNSGKMLLSLISDVLDFSKLESGKVSLDYYEFRLSSVLSEVINMVEQRAVSKGLKLNVEVMEFCPEYLYGDAVKIKQIALNLLTNAIKYTDKGEITFKVTSEKHGETGALLFLEVTDTGRGIKQEDMDKLFEAFTRLEQSKNRNIEGTGLGLSISYNFAKLMGGTISASSEYGKGSTFIAKLPQSIKEYIPIGDFERRYQDTFYKEEDYIPLFKAPKARVLVVDDNITNINVANLLLKETEVKTEMALSGQSAIEACEKEHFDVILLDYMMPEMDGIDTLQHLKEKDLLNTTSVIALTANAVNGAREQYLEEGFDDYLSKPILGRELEALLMKWLPKDTVLVMEQPKENKFDAETFVKDLPVIEGIDWYCATDFFANKEKLVKVLRDICVNGRVVIKEIRKKNDYSDKKTLESLRIDFHSIKSVTKMIGATELSEKAKLLENAAKDGDSEYVGTIIEGYLDEYENLLNLVGNEFSEVNSGKTPYNRETLIKNIQIVIDALENFDSDTSDALIKEINGYSYPDKLKLKVEEFVNFALELNLEKAKKQGQAIIDELE